MQARCRGAFFLFLLPLFFSSAGCRNRTDQVEAELRERSNLYREALEEQRRSELRILALQREIEALRQGAEITPEQAAQTFGLKRIVLGRATSGLDNDALPGDELLQVVVEPRDESEHAIKAPGMLQVFALEVSPQGIKTVLCQWDIPPEQLRQSWKQGLLSSGYTLTLPWKTQPVTEQVRVVARLVTSHGRTYEADKDIKVRVMPGAPAQRPTTPEPPLMPPAPTLVPAARVAPHVTQWRRELDERGVTIGAPMPIDGR